MSFQTSTVNVYNALGIPGAIAFDGPSRAGTFNLVSGAQAQTIGFAFTHDNSGAVPNPALNAPSAGLARVGGTGAFAGILVNPKVYATGGGSAGPLSPTLNLPNNAIGELLAMGEIFVSLPAAANVGDAVLYNTTTGALQSQANSSAFTGVVATNTLTVSAFVAGGAPLGVGSQIRGGATAAGITFITALGTGTGGNGTYTVSGNATVASAALTGSGVAPTGTAFVPNAIVSRYGVAAAGVAVIKLTN